MLETPLERPIWVMKLASHVDALGFCADDLLVRAKLPVADKLDTHVPVPFTQIAAFFEICAAEAGERLLGFKFGRTIDPRDAGLIAFLGVYAQTMRDGLENIATYSRVFGDAAIIDVSRLGCDGRLGFDFSVPVSVETQQYTEWLASALLHGAQSVMRRPIRCRAARFRHLRTLGIEDMRRHLGCTPAFCADENALYFSRGDLDTLIPEADHKLVQFLREVAESTLERHHSNEPPLLISLERALARHLPKGEVKMEQVAQELGLSPRTLSRRLKEEDLSFREVLKGLRQALATRYLSQTTTSQAQIAFLLGFSDQAAFARAYRAWTGRTPGAMRKRFS